MEGKVYNSFSEMLATLPEDAQQKALDSFHHFLYDPCDVDLEKFVREKLIPDLAKEMGIEPSKIPEFTEDYLKRAAANAPSEAELRDEMKMIFDGLITDGTDFEEAKKLVEDFYHLELGA
jgi:hypothetical protein